MNSNYNTDELLNLLKNSSSSKTEIIKSFNPIVNFITFFNLQEGKHKVHIDILYNLYKSWDKEPLLRNNFKRELTKFLPNSKKGNYFLLSKKALKLENETYKYLLEKQVIIQKDINKNKVFDKFLEFYQITNGTCWIEGAALYYLYDLWEYQLKRRSGQLTKDRFFKYCKAYFEYGLGNRILYFKVNSEIKTQLTDQMRREIIQGVTRKWTKKINIDLINLEPEVRQILKPEESILLVNEDEN